MEFIPHYSTLLFFIKIEGQFYVAFPKIVAMSQHAFAMNFQLPDKENCVKWYGMHDLLYYSENILKINLVQENSKYDIQYFF